MGSWAGLLFGGIKCNYMSVIASLGVKEEIKNILDSGGFLRDVQQHLQAKFPQRPATVFGQEVEQNGTGKCSKESKQRGTFHHPKGRKS